MKLKDKKQINGLAALLAITYMISYVTRINFGAIIAEMENATQIPRSLLSMALTGSFITYGAGQIISGVCGDKISPKKLISCGLLASTLMNLCIPLCRDPYQMLAVWCVNGFAQAFLWPPIVRMMTELLTEEDYRKVTVKVSWGGSFGTILVYFAAPLIISLLNWKWVFLICAGCGAIMLLVWNKLALDIVPVAKAQQSESKITSTRALFSPLMLAIMAAIILQGMLKDGVTTWMPTYIADTYQLSSVVSILTGVVLPIFSILSVQVASRLYRRVLPNPLLCAGAFFAIGAVSAVGVSIFSGKAVTLSVLSSALLTGSMHGINLMLISMIPTFFEKYGKVSTASGLLNACSYIGSAISTYGIAVLSETAGWSVTVLLWIGIAAAGMVICFLCTKPWNREFGRG